MEAVERAVILIAACIALGGGAGVICKATGVVTVDWLYVLAWPLIACGVVGICVIVVALGCTLALYAKEARDAE